MRIANLDAFLKLAWNLEIKLLENNTGFRDVTAYNSFAFINEASLSVKNISASDLSVQTGNLVYQQNNAKFILHDEINVDDFQYIKEGVVSFFSHGNLVHYQVTIDGASADSINLSRMIWQPMDQYFSIMWSVMGMIVFKDQLKLEISILRVGGNSLTFKIIGTNARFQKEILNHPMTIGFKLEVDEHNHLFMIKAKVTDIHKINNEYLYDVIYDDLLAKERDTLFRLLFKRQMQLKKINY
jgi:hypothetical protein